MSGIRNDIALIRRTRNTSAQFASCRQRSLCRFATSAERVECHTFPPPPAGEGQGGGREESDVNRSAPRNTNALRLRTCPAPPPPPSPARGGGSSLFTSPRR